MSVSATTPKCLPRKSANPAVAPWVLCVSVLACCLMLWAVPASATPPTGNEFRVNTTTVGDQRTWSETPGAIAMDKDGNFVVVWTSPDDDDTGIFAQRFNPLGIKRGSEFRVNDVIAGSQRFPTVAMDADGDFVVTWTSPDTTGVGSTTIFARRFNALGVPLGKQFLVCTTAAMVQERSTVAMDDAGDFVVVWSRTHSGTPFIDVMGRRFDAKGVGQGDDFVVQLSFFQPGSEGGDHWFIDSAIAMDAVGDFAVSYVENASNGEHRLYVKRYDSAAALLGTTIVASRASPEPDMSFADSSLAMEEDGDFIVAWAQYDTGNGFKGNVRSRRYTLAGVPLTDIVTVNESTTGYNLHPRVAVDTAGDSVICWDHQEDSSAAYDVYARQYSNAGVPEAAAFRVNTMSEQDQRYAHVARNPDGDFVIVWTGFNDQDGDGAGVFGQRFAVNSDGCAAERLIQAARRMLPVYQWKKALPLTAAMSVPAMDDLRRFRDEILQQSETGRKLITAYYQYGPTIAEAAIRRPEQIWPAIVLLREVQLAVHNVTRNNPIVRLSPAVFTRGLTWIDELQADVSSETRRGVEEARRHLLSICASEGGVILLRFDDHGTFK